MSRIFKTIASKSGIVRNILVFQSSTSMIAETSVANTTFIFSTNTSESLSYLIEENLRSELKILVVN